MTCVFVFCLLHTVNGMKSSKSYINTDIWLDDFLKESNDMNQSYAIVFWKIFKNMYIHMSINMLYTYSVRIRRFYTLWFILFYFNGIPQLDDIASFSFVSAKTHECCKIGVYHYVWFF